MGRFTPRPNAGGFWSLNDAPTNTWTSVASSADGKRLVAVVNGGGIYTWQATPTPSLNITASNGQIVLSWTVPSMTFVLQECPDLGATSWTDSAFVPLLNLTNLQYQVSVPPPLTGHNFYRLQLR